MYTDLFTTLQSTGGFTVHVHSNESPTAGEHRFAVAYSKTTERTFKLEAFTLNDLVDFVLDHSDALALPGVFLGAWVDSGTVYLDCSIITADEAEALRVADENEQLAIFCFETMTSKSTH